MNFILVGFKNVGKTTLGALLAEALGYRFIDTDDLLSETMSARALYQTLGEAAFRAREAEVISQLSPTQPTVIATGGGAVLSITNVQKLKMLGKIVYLRQNKETLMARLASDGPLFLQQHFEKHYQERDSRYQASADVEVNLSGLNAVQSVEALKRVVVHGE